MANDAKRTSQLTVTTALANTDRLVVLTNPASSAQTQTITVNNFIYKTINNFPIANTTQRGVVRVDGTTITITANGTLSSGANSINKPVIASNNSVNTTNYSTNATILDITKQIQYLISNGTSGQIHFYLPPGSNGQIMHFAAQTSQHMDDMYIWVDNVRKINTSTLTSPAKWLPFSSANNPRTFGSGVYIDGAWNFDTNDFN